MTGGNPFDSDEQQQAGARPWQPQAAPMTVPIFSTPISNYLWRDSADLNGALANFILRQEEAEPGIARSNVGGWHSGTDLFASEAACIVDLRRRVRSYVDNLFAGFMLEGQQTVERTFRLEGWANVLRHGQYHSVHNHPNAFWSGVYYVTGNPDAGPEHPFSGRLELLDPRPGASLAYTEGTSLYGRVMVNPVAGQMVIFPGWLQHQVHTFFGGSERLTVAFNVIPSW